MANGYSIFTRKLKFSAKGEICKSGKRNPIAHTNAWMYIRDFRCKITYECSCMQTHVDNSPHPASFSGETGKLQRAFYG